MFSLEIQSFAIDTDIEDMISDLAYRAVARGAIAFSLEAFNFVPCYTGYTRAIWLGVIDELRGVARMRFRTPVITGTKPWYFPPWPVDKPNYNIILEDPKQQQDRGFEDGQKAVDYGHDGESAWITITIPEYYGELNYSLNEDEWQSFAYGEDAFLEELEDFLMKQAKYKQALLGVNK